MEIRLLNGDEAGRLECSLAQGQKVLQGTNRGPLHHVAAPGLWGSQCSLYWGLEAFAVAQWGNQISNPGKAIPRQLEHEAQKQHLSRNEAECLNVIYFVFIFS